MRSSWRLWPAFRWASWPPARRWLRGALVGMSGIGRTLPSLAVLMLLLPWLGVGTAPAVVALALLGDSADRHQRRRRHPRGCRRGARRRHRHGHDRLSSASCEVIVPIALPVSLVGLRTATTETIASATLATFVGAGGLGDDIVRGLQTDDAPLLFAAAALVAALALAADLALGARELAGAPRE